MTQYYREHPLDGLNPGNHHQPHRLSFRNSLVPTSRFTLTPRTATTATFAPAPSVPSHIAELGDNSRGFGSASTLAVLQGKRIRTNDTFSTSGSSIYSTTHDEKTSRQDSSPHGELPKIAIKCGLRSNWMLMFPHLLAISVTIAVCQLSFRNVFWMDLLPPESEISPGLTQSGVLNLLQLVAKLHEIIILGSISAIVLHVFQASLTGPDGIPLGLMANAFELGSGSFLQHKSFWTSIVSSGDSKGGRFRFTHLWALSFFATLMVMISGPSSAIAIIPSLNYFDLPKPFNQTIRPLYIFNQSTELWPTQLTAASLNAPNSGINCSDAALTTGDQNVCPAGGFREIYSWSGNAMFADVDQARNISFQDESSNTRRIVTVQSCSSKFDGRASGAGINAFLHRALTVYWVFAQKNFHGKALLTAQPQINVDSSVTKLYAPRVEVLCNSFDNHLFDPQNPSSQPAMTFPTFDSSVVPVPDFAYKYNRSIKTQNFTFVHVPNQKFLGAVLTHPILEIFDNRTTQSTENLACSIYTSWIPITASFEPTITDQITYQILSPLHSTCLQMHSPSSSNSNTQQINTTITSAFSSAINQKILFTTTKKHVFDGIFERSIAVENRTGIINATFFRTPTLTPTFTNLDLRQRRARLIATVLAGTVTDALARTAGNGVFPYTSPILLLPNRTVNGELQGKFLFTSQKGGTDLSLNTTSFEETRNWVRVKLSYRRFGYGYKFAGARFGVLVLLVHSCVAAGYMGWFVWKVGGRGKGVGRAWGTMGELWVLGLGSSSVEGGRGEKGRGTRSGSRERLANTCAGVEKVGTWREVVAVRETDDGGLGIVIGREEVERTVGRRARAGVRYG